MNNTVMLKEIKSQAKVLSDAHNVNIDNIALIGQTIKAFNPKMILLVARGTSLHAAYYAKYLIEIYYHKPVSIISPVVFTGYDQSMELDETVVIAISQSGSGRDILEVVKKANATKAITLAITNDPKSAVAVEGKYDLYNEAGEAVSYAATKTYTSAIYLLHQLIYEITKAPELILSIDDAVNAVNLGLSYEDKIANDVDFLIHSDFALTLSRGITYTLAKEMSLKMKEACHFPVDAYPASEFYHGPIVVAGPKAPAILFAVDKTINEDMLKLAHDLKSLNTKMYIITNSNIFQEFEDVLLIDEKNDTKAFFASIVIMQMFVSYLSVKRGFNPDFHETLEHIDTL